MSEKCGQALVSSANNVEQFYTLLSVLVVLLAVFKLLLNPSHVSMWFPTRSLQVQTEDLRQKHNLVKLYEHIMICLFVSPRLGELS